MNDTIEWGKEWSFIKVFTSELHEIMLDLSGGAVGVMHILSTYIEHNSNLVCIMSSDNPINNNDIAYITGLSKPTVNKIMNELVEHKVFARVKAGTSYRYHANPWLFCKGNTIDKSLQKIFYDYNIKTLGNIKFGEIDINSYITPWIDQLANISRVTKKRMG